MRNSNTITSHVCLRHFIASFERAWLRLRNEEVFALKANPTQLNQSVTPPFDDIQSPVGSVPLLMQNMFVSLELIRSQFSRVFLAHDGVIFGNCIVT